METSSKAKSSANKVSSLKQLGRVVINRDFTVIPFDKNELQSILKIEVCSTSSKNKVAKLTFRDNTQVKFLLDFDTNAEVGDRLRKSSIELRQYSTMDSPVLYGELV